MAGWERANREVGTQNRAKNHLTHLKPCGTIGTSGRPVVHFLNLFWCVLHFWCVGTKVAT